MTIELTCETCGERRPLPPPEVEALVAAFQAGDMEPLRCPTCGMSLARALQRALTLPPPAVAPAPGRPARRRHVRLPFDLPVAYELPGGERGAGRLKNLSDGGLCLLSGEALAPATPLRLQLQARVRVHAREGAVVWAAAEPGFGKTAVAHGIRFTDLVRERFAVELFLTESSPRPG